MDGSNGIQNGEVQFDATDNIGETLNALEPTGRTDPDEKSAPGLRALNADFSNSL